MKKVSTSALREYKQSGEKIAAITAYDASFAKLFDAQQVDVILIGDSLGMVLKGENDTLAVTIDDVAYHTASAKRGVSRALVVADMPFMSYAIAEQTYKNAAKLMASGANMVKLEGGAWLTESIQGLVQRGIPVCGHIGLTPQSVNVFGGFKIQGRGEEQVKQLIKDAKSLAQAGVQMIVVECVPTDVGKLVANAVDVPVIGIGAGKYTDGQILVMHDMLGISANYMPKFSKNYLAEHASINDAVAAYVAEVKSGDFPSAKHSFE